MCSILNNHYHSSSATNLITSVTMMRMALSRRLKGYSKMEKEDSEDRKHRQAQFLIYKVLDKVDSRRKPSSLRIRIFKLKIKIGNNCRRMKKKFFLRCHSVLDHVKTLKQMLVIN